MDRLPAVSRISALAAGIALLGFGLPAGADGLTGSVARVTRNVVQVPTAVTRTVTGTVAGHVASTVPGARALPVAPRAVASSLQQSAAGRAAVQREVPSVLGRAAGEAVSRSNAPGLGRSVTALDGDGLLFAAPENGSVIRLQDDAHHATRVAGQRLEADHGNAISNRTRATFERDVDLKRKRAHAGVDANSQTGAASGTAVATPLGRAAVEKERNLAVMPSVETDAGL